MLVWKRIDSGDCGPRPVPDRAATSSVWAVVAVAALVVVTVFNSLDQVGTTSDLVALSLVTALASAGARLAAAPGTALLCWAILNAFAAPPVGQLTWAAPDDLTRIACLLAAAGIGTATARLAHARAAYRRLSQ